MTGRPKPTALKILNGSAARNPGRLNPDEPKPEPLTVVPAPPAYLPLAGRARKAWDDLAAQTIALGVLTAADLPALAMTCRALAEYEAARRDDMAWRRADAAWKRFMAGVARFGLDPADRARVHAAPKPNDSRMAALLKPRLR